LDVIQVHLIENRNKIRHTAAAKGKQDARR